VSKGGALLSFQRGGKGGIFLSTGITVSLGKKRPATCLGERFHTRGLDLILSGKASRASTLLQEERGKDPMLGGEKVSLLCLGGKKEAA